MNTTAIANVILIDDESTMRASISQFMSLSDCEVQSFANPAEAVNALSADFTGVVVSDLLEAVNFIDPQIPLVLITGHGDIDSAVLAMREGAYDFIEKPFQPQRLLTTVLRAQEKRRLILSNRQLRKTLGSPTDVSDCLLGECDAIRAIRQDIRRFADINVNVLITGENGTGKSVVAQCLHTESNKPHSASVRINCDAKLSQDSLRNSLSECRGGTAILESIDQLPQNLLSGLQFLLQENNVRLISTTEKTNLKILDHTELRIDTISLTLPPLSARNDDIAMLFEHFASLAALRFNSELPVLTTADIAVLQTLSWPGNLHDLERIAERYVLYQTQSLSQLIDQTGNNTTALSLNQQVQRFERSIIERALANHKGRLADAANELGVPRRTLNDKLQRHEIDRERFQP